MKQNRWPELWKNAFVVLVHKRGSKKEAYNYRPISFLPIIGKVFERLFTSALIAFFIENSLLNNRRFGFREGKSGSNLLLNLSSDWQQSLDRNVKTSVVALDISLAFYRVWHKGLAIKLQSMGVQGYLFIALVSCLQDRKLHVAINGNSSFESSIIGCVPQGSVFGPPLCNVYFNDILPLIHKASACADDCTVPFTSSQSPNMSLQDTVNHTLDIMVQWIKNGKLNWYLRSHRR